MKPGWRLAACAALVWACACREADDVAQTVVWIDATTAAREAISRLELQAEGPSDNLEPAVETKKPDWPIKLVLAPKQGDAGRRFTLHITGYDAQDNRLATIRFASGFVAKQSRYASVLIHDACVQAPATCAACNSYLLPLSASELSRDARKPRELDALCGGPDTVPPGSSDAGSAGSVNAGQGAAGVGPLAGSGGTAGTGGQPGACGPGYLQSAGACVDIDDCQNANPCGRGQCMNTPGAYVCECEPGFESRSGTCVSLDDCQTNNGGCESNCQMSPAGPVCSCAPQQWLKADRKSCAAFGRGVQLNRTGSTVPTQPAIAFGPEGNGLAVWRQSDGMTTALWARHYVAGKGWAASAIKLPFDEPGEPASPRVALAANGRGEVVWVQNEDAEGDVWSVRYDEPDFGEPRRIDLEGSGDAEYPTVQLDSAGNGFAAWTQTGGTNAEIWVNRVLADKGWQTPEAIKTTGNEQAFTAQLALDDHGNAELTWTQSTFSNWTEGNSGGWTEWMSGNGQGVRFAPWTARFDSKMERWHAQTKLDDTGSAGFPEARLFGPEGNRVAVWPRMINGVVSVRASAYTGKGPASDSIDISARGSEFNMVYPRLALAPSGDGAAVWTELRDSTHSIWANRHRGASAEWLGASELASLDSATGAPLPQIAIDPSGSGVAVWSEIRGTSGTIKAARLQADVGFVGDATLATTVTGTETPNSPAQVAVNAQGTAVALWEELERGLYFVSASVFE